MFIYLLNKYTNRLQSRTRVSVYHAAGTVSLENFTCILAEFKCNVLS